MPCAWPIMRPAIWSAPGLTGTSSCLCTSELVRELGCPLVLHICGNTADRLEYICQAGFDAFHFDSKVPAVTARDITRGRLSLVGNVNNPEILLRGTPEDAYRAAMAALEAGVDVVGPECAVPLATPNANLTAIARAARDFVRNP